MADDRSVLRWLVGSEVRHKPPVAERVDVTIDHQYAPGDTVARDHLASSAVVVDVLSEPPPNVLIALAVPIAPRMRTIGA